MLERKTLRLQGGEGDSDRVKDISLACGILAFMNGIQSNWVGGSGKQNANHLTRLNKYITKPKKCPFLNVTRLTLKTLFAG